tara:strand:- start:3113 stop:3313 length:201 start_codon:yes stop_codon:yes gene_type:complete
VFLNALLDLAHANIKIASHLDRTTERDLSITLREVKIFHRDPTFAETLVIGVAQDVAQNLFSNMST